MLKSHGVRLIGDPETAMGLAHAATVVVLRSAEANPDKSPRQLGVGGHPRVEDVDGAVNRGLTPDHVKDIHAPPRVVSVANHATAENNHSEGQQLWQGHRVPDYPSRTLAFSGLRAEIHPDRWVPGAFTLVVDGTPQSHVNLDDPSQLFFEYIQRMGHTIDQLGMPGQPLTAVHLGAGALTIPRYVEATRPGSRQQVIELESDLMDFVRAELPWSKRAQIRVRHGDAREVVAKLPNGLLGTVDLVVVDVFSGARTPAHITSIEFYRTIVPLLKPDGIVLVNVADGPGLAFARGQAATLVAAIGNVAALAETQILKGRRFGNIVLVGSPGPLPLEWMPRLLAGGPHPSKVVDARELREFIGGASVVTDLTAVRSPPPSKGIFQVRPGGD